MDHLSKSRKQNYEFGPRGSVLNQLGATRMNDSKDYGFDWIDNDTYDWDSSRREEFKMSKRETTKGWNAYGATLLDNDGRPIHDNVGRTVRENLGASRRVDLGTTGETRLEVSPDFIGRTTYGGRNHEQYYHPESPEPPVSVSHEPLPPVKERVLYPSTEPCNYDVDDGFETPDGKQRRWTSIAADKTLMRQWHDMFGKIRTKWSSNSGFDSMAAVSNMSHDQSYSDKEDNYDKRARLHRLALIGGAFIVVLLVAVLVPVILLTGSKDNQTEEVLLKYEYEVTVNNRNYSEDMANRSSEAFTAAGNEFCDQLDRNAENKTNEEFTYQGCAVNEITQGSLVIRYTLIILSVTTPTANQVSNVVGITISGDQQDVGDFSFTLVVIISAAVVISEDQSPVRKKVQFNTACSVSKQERCVTKYSECIDNVCSCPVDRYHNNATDECTLIDCGVAQSIDNGTVTESGSRYGSVLNITCEHGYELSVNATVNCSSQGSWGDLPSCEPVKCHEFIKPNYSDVDTNTTGRVLEDRIEITLNTTGHRYGDLITVTCQSGYTLIGEYSLYCNKDGTWPAVYCTKINCTDNFVKPNNSIVIGWNESTSTIEIGCEDGFNIIGNSSVTCLDKATWSISPVCEAKDCGHPGETLNAVSIGLNSTTFNSRFSVECNEGFNSSDLLTVTCQSDGTWSKFPTCNLVSCGNITVPEFANITIEEGNTYGKNVTFECREGFELEGNSEISCQKNGSWTGYPVCKIKDCGQISEISDGIVFNETGTTFGSMVHVKCNEGFDIVGNDVVSCLSTGRWNVFPTCLETDCGNYSPPEHTNVGPNNTLSCDIGYELIQYGVLECIDGNWSNVEGCKPVQCGSFPTIENANTSKAEEKTYVFGDTVEILCNDGFEITGSSEAKCGANRTWKNVPKCDKITCQDFLVPSNAFIGEQETKNRVFEDEILVNCSDGYSVTGNERTMCGANREWLNIPTCNPIACNKLEIPNSNQPGNVQYKYNESVTVTCTTGYILEGLDTLTCSENGTWIDTPTCNPVPCDQLNIPNASFEPDQTGFIYNESVRVTCNSGYLLEGNDTLKCLENGSWIDIPTCNPVPCDQLNIPNASFEPDQTGFIYNESVRVTCNSGYKLEGNGTLSCFENGSWIDIPTCNALPCDQLNIPNASLEPDQKGFIYNESVRVKCNSGYLLEGNDTLKCLENGSWIDIPTCNPVPCDQLNIPNASLEPDQTGFIYNESVRVTCKSGYILEGNNILNCFENGSWIDIPTCNALPCDQLNIPNASLEPDQKGFIYNESVRVKCNSGYILEGNDTLKCLENGSWIDIPTCNPLTCDQLNIPNASLEPDQTGFIYNENVRVTCSSGYKLEGNDTLKCLENGSWIDIPTCNALPCDQLNIPNASLEPDQKGFIYNESVRVKCNSGYILEGNDTLKCLENGSWIDIPTCDPVDCEPLPFPDFAVVPQSQKQYVYNENVTIACKTGYRLDRNESVSCQANSSWSDLPSCAPIECKEFIHPDNSESELNTTGHRYGDLITVTCQSGYTLFGEYNLSCNNDGTWPAVYCAKINCTDNFVKPNNSIVIGWNESTSIFEIGCVDGYNIIGNSSVTCLNNATWSISPVCEARDCGHPGKIPNAVSIGLNSTTFNSRFSVECNEGFNSSDLLTVTCQSDGTWSKFPTCNLVSCGNITVPEFANITIEEGNTYGKNVTFECREGFELEGNSEISCQKNGSWTGYPVCKIKDCGQISEISDGIVFNETGTTFGSMVHVKCNEGFDIVGRDVVTCLSSGRWDILPSCLETDCGNYSTPEHTYLGPNNTLSCDIGYELIQNAVLECIDGNWSNVEGCKPVQCGSFPTIENANTSKAEEKTYVFGDTVEILCNDGFEITGSSEAKCGANRTWKNVPKCDKITCVQLNIPNASLEPDLKQYLYNESVRVTCNLGYTIVGNDTLSCFENGSWIHIPTCNPVPCEQLNISNASLEPDKTRFLHNETVRITCNSGYSLEGNDTLNCFENGSWIDIPTCYQIFCDQLNISNASIEPDQKQYLYNETVRVTCDIGYILDGNDTLSCFGNGSWIDIPTCKAGPCNQLNIPHASLEPDLKQYLYNDSVRVTCNMGYTLVGNDTLSCFENGSWIHIPTCNPVPCEQLNIPNASLDPNKIEFKYNETVGVSCNTGYTLEGNATLSCFENGSWINIPTCTPIPCDLLRIDNADVDPKKNNYSYAENITVQCMEGYQLEGNEVIGCNENGTWINASMCIPVRCEQPSIQNARFSPNKTEYKYNENVTVVCDFGYTIKGDEIVYCAANRTWTNVSSCIPAECKLFTLPENAFVSIKKGRHVYNDSVTLECRDGYELVGNSTIKCQANTTWTELPICKPKTCEPLQLPDYAKADTNFTDLNFEDEISVSCKSGFVSVGFNNLSCNANGTWPDIICVEVNCSTDILKLENSVIIDMNDTVSSFEIRCTEGYQIVGNSSVTCLDGNWSQIPTCEIVNCSNYIPISNTYVVSSDTVTTYNSSLNITCIAGLEFTNDSARVITCGANGQWNGIPVCNITGKVSFIEDGYSLIEGGAESIVCEVTQYPNWQTVIVAKLDIMNTGLYIPIVRIFHENESVVNETLDENYITKTSLKTDGVSVTVIFQKAKCDDEGIYICAAIIGDPIAPIEMKQARTNVSVSCPDGCGEFIPNADIAFDVVKSNTKTAINTSVPVKCIDGLEFTNDSTTYVTCGADGEWVGQPECKIPGKVSFIKTAYSFEIGDTEMIMCEVTNYSSWQKVLVAKQTNLTDEQVSPVALVTNENDSFPVVNVFDGSYKVNATAREDGVIVSILLSPSVCASEGLYRCAAVVGDEENPIDSVFTETRVTIISTPSPDSKSNVSTPTISKEPENFYKNQQVSLKCTGDVGRPKGDLVLQVKTQNGDKWQEIPDVTRTEEETSNCTTLVTLSYVFYVDGSHDGNQYRCKSEGDEGESLNSSIVVAEVIDSVVSFTEAGVTAEIGSDLELTCILEGNLANNHVVISRKTISKEEIICTMTSIDTVVCTPPRISGNATFSESNRIVTINIDAAECDDEGTYFCTSVNDTSFQTSINVSLTKSPAWKPMLSLPNRMVLDYKEPSLSISCNADVGYPPGDLRLEYSRDNSTSYSTFDIGTAEANESKEGCSVNKSISYTSYTYTQSWNNTSLRCAVYRPTNTSEEPVIVSDIQTIYLIINECPSPGFFYLNHPLNCHFYISCNSGAPTVVDNCGNNCPNIVNNTITPHCTGNCTELCKV